MESIEIFNEKDIIEKIKQLESDQLVEVMDFIEFITEKKKKSLLTGFLNHTTEVSVGLEEIRKRLSKIPGKMSEVVRELRDERG